MLRFIFCHFLNKMPKRRVDIFARRADSAADGRRSGRRRRHRGGRLRIRRHFDKGIRASLDGRRRRRGMRAAVGVIGEKRTIG